MAGRTAESICNMALLYSGVNQVIGNLATDKTAAAQACNTLYDEKRKNLLSAFHWPFTIKRVQLTPYSGNVYVASQTYANGDMVQFGNNVYRSLQAANTGNEPDLTASAAWWFQVTRDGWAFACPVPNDFVDPIAVWEKQTTSALQSQSFYNYRDPISPNLRNPRSDERQNYVIENMNDGTDGQILLTDLDTPILKYTADVTNPNAMPTEFVEALAWDLAGPLAMGLRGDEKKAAACAMKAKMALGDAFVVSMRDQQEDVEPDSEFVSARRGC